MSNQIINLPANSYLALTSPTCTFNSYLGTSSPNQWDWFTNVYYDGAAFVRDDPTKTAWRVAQVVDAYDSLVVNHWDGGGALTTPFRINGKGEVVIIADGLDPKAEQIEASNIEGTRSNALAAGLAIPAGSSDYEGIGVYGAVTNASKQTNAVAGMFSARATGPGASDSARVNIWGVNSLLEDGSPKAGTHYPWVGLQNEWDFNVFDPNTKVVAHSIGGAGSVQPAVALGYLVNFLGAGLKWDFGFSVMEGTAAVAFSAGPAGGTNASSQPLRLYGRDLAGVAHSVDVTATPKGSLHVSTSITLPPITAPDPPASGFVLYTDSADGRLKSKSASGSVTVLA